MADILQDQHNLVGMRELITAAMSDCDLPADREEFDRLAAYRGVVIDMLRGKDPVCWNLEAQQMAEYLTGGGPSPLTVLGHSRDWCGGAGDVHETPAPAGSWAADVLALARPAQGPPQGEHGSARAPQGHAGPAGQRRWIDVPYDERELAKRAGAVWDPVAKSWYAPVAGIAALAPWARLREDLPGEDRSLGSGLFVDLIPVTSWWNNARTAISKRDWFRIRQMVRRRAGQRCEACGAGEDKAARRYLECHERWEYEAGRQVLRRLICLCSWCHSTTHAGLAQFSGQGDFVFAHLCRVTGMSPAQAGKHMDDAFRLWESRNNVNWAVDLSLLSGLGIEVTSRPEGPGHAAAS